MFFIIGAFCLVSAQSTKDAEAITKEAIAFYKANGKQATLAEISKPKGKFDKGELYVFAYDMNMTVIAHPNRPVLIGKNLLEVKDWPGGKYFRKEIQQIAKTKGSGWVDYEYQNPKTKKLEPKTTYFEKVDDIIICAGVYKK